MRSLSVLCLSLVTASSLSAQETVPSDYRTYGPYCGIYSLYGAMQIHNRPANLKDLIDVRYVPTGEGSSIENLIQAGRDHAVTVRAYRGLTPNVLRNVTVPVILHVRRPGYHTSYNHWVLYVGDEADKARIVDGPESILLIPYAELFAMSDGIGLVVGSDDATATLPIWTAWLESAVILGVVVFIAYLGTHLTSKRLRAVSVVGSAIAFALLWHSLDTDGLFRNLEAVHQVAARHFEPESAIVDRSEVERDLSTDALIVDARPEWAFKIGHLPGAVNLPIDASMNERARFVEPLSKDRKIVLYCQSNGCGWADSIAADLILRGYDNVRIYRGGYNDWTSDRSETP